MVRSKEEEHGVGVRRQVFVLDSEIYTSLQQPFLSRTRLAELETAPWSFGAQGTPG